MRHSHALGLLATIAVVTGTAVHLHAQAPQAPQQPHRAPPEATYRALPDQPFAAQMAKDIADKPGVMQRQGAVLERRYDLADRPLQGVMMSGGRKPVQGGVRVKLPQGQTWESLARLSPQEIRQGNLLPEGFLPLPHVKHAEGGMVFPNNQIDETSRQEQRNLRRFDVDFDLPERFTPEFPPPLFLTTRPELGDVAKGELLTISNYYRLMVGILTPVQMDGLRLLLTPFPQQQFNQTEDRKSPEQSRGVTCLDCHANFHTNATFHLTPDLRPQAVRFRIDTVSLRGMFNQKIHGSKRSLRSVEDFTEFEQRTAYFDGDNVSGTRKGVHLPNRVEQVSLMAQMQNIADFPPAPKLDPAGKLDPRLASQQELAGERIFFGKGRCAECHALPAFLDDRMHDLKLERFYEAGKEINGQQIIPDGPIKTFTLRGIKDSPPYMHDGRLLTLDDTVEFFNLVMGLQLTAEEKASLVTYMLAL
jgi:cytochrome c peroxidase